MDIVITYVNGLVPEWRKSYAKTTGKPFIEKRFRDWGTLKYLMRGIEINMPFIKNVHLVVSHYSQVPEWVNRRNVNIVLHRDIIPAELLPTFNSNTIEMHLHNIKNLAEEFLYFNDDMFPVAPAKDDDFFREGKAVIGFTRHCMALNMFKKICRNSDRLARKTAGMGGSLFFLRPQHICSPLLKSVCKDVYEKAGKEIFASLSRTRTAKNCTQYLFLDYMLLNGMAINRKIEKRHFSLAMTPAGKIRSFIMHPTRKMVCINDVHLSEWRYTKLRRAITEAFEIRFPKKSKYEREDGKMRFPHRRRNHMG